MQNRFAEKRSNRSSGTASHMVSQVDDCGAMSECQHHWLSAPGGSALSYNWMLARVTKRLPPLRSDNVSCSYATVVLQWRSCGAYALCRLSVGHYPERHLLWPNAGFMLVTVCARTTQSSAAEHAAPNVLFTPAASCQKAVPMGQRIRTPRGMCCTTNPVQPKRQHAQRNHARMHGIWTVAPQSSGPVGRSHQQRCAGKSTGSGLLAEEATAPRH